MEDCERITKYKVHVQQYITIIDKMCNKILHEMFVRVLPTPFSIKIQNLTFYYRWSKLYGSPQTSLLPPHGYPTSISFDDAPAVMEK